MAILDPLRRPPPAPATAVHDAPTVWICVGVLVAYNVIGNLLLPAPLYVPVNLAVAAALVWDARRGGLSWAELGMDPARVRDGLRVGGVVVVVVAVVIGLGVLLPATRRFFADARAGDASMGGLLYQTLVRIPVGTVVLEEVAFRGVFLGLLRRHTTTPLAVMWSSLLFGLWHVIPGFGAAHANRTVNEMAGGSAGVAVAVAAAVVSTAVAGVLFCWVRLRADSVVAPMLAHVATNSIAFAVAWWVLRGP